MFIIELNSTIYLPMKIIFGFYLIVGMTMERAKLEINPPSDRYKLIFLILLIHGVGTLTPWNMFINAKEVIITRKLKNVRKFNWFYFYYLFTVFYWLQTEPKLHWRRYSRIYERLYALHWFGVTNSQCAVQLGQYIC